MALLPRIVHILLITQAYARPSYRPLDTRASDCGGIAGLNHCGGFYPSDFCCPQSSECLPLNTTSVVAVICCPAGIDCRTVQPTTCDVNAYDASKAPLNQVHIRPLQRLATCGNACCPSGFSCRDGSCHADAAAPSSSLSASNTSPSSTPTTGSNSVQTSSIPANPTTETRPTSISTFTEVQAGPGSFSGSSFAAGFVPGIAVGMLLLWLVFWLRKRFRWRSPSRRTRTDTAEQVQNAPPMITISQPTYDDYLTHRSDFLRSVSHEHERNLPADRSSTSLSYVERDRKSSDASTDLRPMLDFQSEYSQPRSPSPALLLHKALSFRFSPQGKLRNKQSIHSLRRHMADQARHEEDTPRISRSDSSESTGTIKVALTTDQSHRYGSHNAQHISAKPATPTRSSRFLLPHVLDSPYTPSRYHDSFSGPPRSEKRVTTFSSLMERAGFRRRDFDDAF